MLRHGVVGGALAIGLGALLFLLMRLLGVPFDVDLTAEGLWSRTWAALTENVSFVALLAVVFGVGALGGAVRYVIRQRLRNARDRRRRSGG